MSSALTKATTKAKRNNNKTGEGSLIWEMSNKTCIMIIVLLLTILVTVVEMIMDLFASFPFNVHCKEVYAKANCAEINFREGEVLVQRACVFKKCFHNCDRECIVGIIMVKAYFLSVNELSMRYVKSIALGKMVCWN